MQNNKNILFLVVFMGLLVGLPALTTDIYLPSFPALASFFDTSASSIQMTLTATMIGVALGQLVIGPLSDKYGRKTPLVVSLAAFIVTTAFIIYTKDVVTL
jgi:DHA1 family bicyclomycin/chloramphenicol resistance-like MFS transporter